MPAMPETPAPDGEEVRLSLQLTLRLTRQRPDAAWTAELSAPNTPQKLAFASLPALIGYIARLDRPAPVRGLR
jgi:hypothetical protein